MAVRIKTTTSRKVKIFAGIRNSNIYISSSGNILTTADLGMIHEFGTPNLVARSWLIKPFNEFMANNKFDQKKETIDEFCQRLKDYIVEGFYTQGHGTWEVSQTKTPYKQKHSKTKIRAGDAINLTDSGGLRDSIEVWYEWVQN